jgi:hypothetical protein
MTPWLILSTPYPIRQPTTRQARQYEVGILFPNLSHQHDIDSIAEESPIAPH